MRILIVSDVHSNLEAFQSVIDDAQGRGGFDAIWCLGDLVGYGPDPGPCIELPRQYDHVAVAGNHDLAAIGRLGLEGFNPHAAAANRWTATQLTEEHVRYLDGLPLQVETGDCTLVHGSPRDPVWEYVVTRSSAVATFMHCRTPICLVGHSHIPFICRPTEDGALFLEFPVDTPLAVASERLIINPGGVGQPRDGDPRASYAIYDDESRVIRHYRTEYDIPTVQQKMLERGLPRYLAERLAFGR